MTDILRLAAFTQDPAGGNPAGVVLDASGLDAGAMLAIAAEVGYSETAFLVRRPEAPCEYDVRFFAPENEVPFCGHATVASGIALGHGDHRFHTAAGPVDVRVRDGLATLTIAVTEIAEAPAVDRVLAALGWTEDDLDPELPPRRARVGGWYYVLGVRTRERLSRLHYDFDALRALSQEHDVITFQLVQRQGPAHFHSRNPFPFGGVVEDPATGAAAAALGAYLRELGLVTPPVTIDIRQGEDMGRPSRLLVDLEPGRPEVSVSGAAVPIRH